MTRARPPITVLKKMLEEKGIFKEKFISQLELLLQNKNKKKGRAAIGLSKFVEYESAKSSIVHSMILNNRFDYFKIFALEIIKKYKYILPSKFTLKEVLDDNLLLFKNNGIGLPKFYEDYQLWNHNLIPKEFTYKPTPFFKYWLEGAPGKFEDWQNSLNPTPVEKSALKDTKVSLNSVFKPKSPTSAPEIPETQLLPKIATDAEVDGWIQDPNSDEPFLKKRKLNQSGGIS